mmetsp:Transcript_51021/g.85358  ORF Transcript_51021/g.85358 Transcript_51021/m.85358 type:complete len:243 (-) Transcript_51021:248-976(-)
MAPQHRAPAPLGAACSRWCRWTWDRDAAASTHASAHLLQSDVRDISFALRLLDQKLCPWGEQVLFLIGVERDGGDIAGGLGVDGQQRPLAPTSVHEPLGHVDVRSATGHAPPCDCAAHGVLVVQVHTHAAPQLPLVRGQTPDGLQKHPQICKVLLDFGPVLVAKGLVQIAIDGIASVEHDGSVEFLAHLALGAARLLGLQGLALVDTLLHLLCTANALRCHRQRSWKRQVHNPRNGRSVIGF